MEGFHIVCSVINTYSNMIIYTINQTEKPNLPCTVCLQRIKQTETAEHTDDYFHS